MHRRVAAALRKFTLARTDLLLDRFAVVSALSTSVMSGPATLRDGRLQRRIMRAAEHKRIRLRHVASSGSR